MTLDRCLLLAALLSVPAGAAAQDRITINLAPRPGQVLHTRMATDIKMSMSSDTADTPLPPQLNQPFGMSMVIEGDMNVGAPDEQGRYDARLILDVFSMDATFGGQPAPRPGPMLDVAGKEFVMTFDRQGAIVDMKVPPELGNPDAVRKMLTSLTGLSAPITLAIGETVTRPTEFGFPAGGTNAL